MLIEEISEDGLTREYWEYRLREVTGAIHLQITSYGKGTRPTKRHKTWDYARKSRWHHLRMIQSEHWKGYGMDAGDVPLLSLEELQQHVASKLKVVSEL